MRHFAGRRYEWMFLVVCSAMLLAACQPVVQTQTVEIRVVETQVVTVEKTRLVPAFYATVPAALGDRRVRQALAYCTDKLALVRAVYPYLSEAEQSALLMHSFVPPESWAYPGDEKLARYPFDPQKGGALLEEAGWIPGEGGEFRRNAAGLELAFQFTSNDVPFRRTWAAVWEEQMRACGVRITRFHAPGTWWFGETSGLARRDFELGAFVGLSETEPHGETIYACDAIPARDNNWQGQNYAGWCNDEASRNVRLASRQVGTGERKVAYSVVQQEYTHDVPALPLFRRVDTYAHTAGLQGFAPGASERLYTGNIAQWRLPGKDTLVLGLAQEPAGLNAMTASQLEAQIANQLIGGLAYTQVGYTYQPALLHRLASLEEGQAELQNVTVRQGERVMDATGKLVELKPGVQVYDANGQPYVFDGKPLQMKQLVARYEWIAGLKWSDGYSLSAQDFQLYQKIFCDREAGFDDSGVCDRVQRFEALSNGYRLTWRPGVLEPLYFLPPFGAAPAHRRIESPGAYQGRTLAEVPAKDWAALPEVDQDPLGFGPYVLKQWQKGEKMVFEANPYYAPGAPQSKNLVIVFVRPENAEAQLLAGQVDVLGPQTLAGLSEALQQGAEEGKIVVRMIPAATWEQIAFNLSYADGETAK